MNHVKSVSLYIHCQRRPLGKAPICTYHLLKFSKSKEYLYMNQGDQVSWYWPTFSSAWAFVSSISQIKEILCSHYFIVGVVVDFQYNGIRDLAAFSRCLEREFLYFWRVKFEM